jgi:glycosyltransferase involved in cell wall biosynthesis
MSPKESSAPRDLLSIIIPCHNASGTIVKLLDSIQSASDENVETLVVDDRSTDGSTAIASRYPVRVVCHPERRGPAACRNLGAMEARGKILLFLDADVILYPDTVRRFRETFRQDPDVRAVVGAYSKEAANPGWVPRYRALMSAAYYAGKKVEPIDAFLTAMGAVDREVFLGLKGFDIAYTKPDMEDLEFGHRLSREYPVLLNPDIQVRHHFPGFYRNTRNYFSRAFAWTGLFLRRGRFERYQTTAETGFGKAAGFLGVCLLTASPLSTWTFLASLPVFAFYFHAHRKFYGIVLDEPGWRPKVTMLVLDLYYSVVVTLGAIAGFLFHGISRPWKLEKAGS